MPGLLQYDRGARVLIIPPADLSALPALPLPLLFNPMPPISGVPAVPQLAVEFSVSKAISPEPNPWTVRLMNVAPTTRNTIAGKITSLRSWKPIEPVALVDGVLVAGGQLATTTLSGMAHVRLDAGYNGELSPVLSGAAESVRGDWVGETHVLEISGSDGGFNVHASTPWKVFPAGTPAGAILQYLASTLGGAVLAPTAGLGLLSAFTLPGGASIQGDAQQGITDLCDPLELSWWMEETPGGPLLLYILAPGEVLPGDPVVVSPAPIPGAIQLRRTPEPVDGGGLRITCQLAPSIKLAHQVLLASAYQQGPYRVEAVEHKGNNRGGEWTTIATIRNPAFEIGI